MSLASNESSERWNVLTLRANRVCLETQSTKDIHSTLERDKEVLTNSETQHRDSNFKGPKPDLLDLREAGGPWYKP